MPSKKQHKEEKVCITKDDCGMKHIEHHGPCHVKINKPCLRGRELEAFRLANIPIKIPKPCPEVFVPPPGRPKPDLFIPAYRRDQQAAAE